MDKKTIKINYIDFWPDLDKENFYFTQVLRRHFNVEFSDDPDYLFCSCFGNNHFKYMNAVKILFLGENIVPDFNIYDYAMGFHFIDFEDRYLRYPLYALYDKAIDLALNKHTFSEEYYLSKKGFCNYVISNPNAAGERSWMAEKLAAYKQVDSGGRYRNNVGGPVKDKLAFSKNYRFTMAFENSKMSGYTTEKIFEAFAADTIPIYWGSPRVTEEFNPKAFVDCNQFATLDEAVERVKEINENDELFLEMIKAPIITDNCLAKQYLSEDYLDSFFINIFSQDRENAIRRNMVYIGRDYQHKMALNKKHEARLDIIKKPMHLMNKKKAQLKSRLAAKKR